MAGSEQNVDLLNKAIETFNAASSTVVHYYRSLEEKVKLLTEEVEHKKQLLNSILDSIDVGVVFFDRDGIIRMINKAAERLLHVDASEIIGGSSLRAQVHDEVIAPENGRPFYALTSRMEVKDGGGTAIGSVFIFKDITKLKELEAENERNMRLTAMGELVMKIAHEIRNPLGSIELFASLLSADLKGTEYGDYANRISNSVRYLVNTLDNMLRFTREIKPSLEYGCLNEIVEETCNEFRELFSNKKIKITYKAEGEYWLPFDRGLIRQTLINILLNAVHAMPDGGAIEMTMHDAGENIELSVMDTGTGMDEYTRSRIFEPFFSTKDRGTGLGMSITAGIIKAHKGTIEVKSEIGKGTEFIIKLPK